MIFVVFAGIVEVTLGFTLVVAPVVDGLRVGEPIGLTVAVQL